MVYLLWRACHRGHDVQWYFLLLPGQIPSGSWKTSECLDRWVVDRAIDAPMFTVLADLRR